MMAAAHITTGIAAALAIRPPTTFREAGIAVLGGSIGGLICDIDVHSTRRNRDALIGRIAVLLLVCMVITADRFAGMEIVDRLIEKIDVVRIFSLICFLCVCGMMRRGSHRGFSHSAIALFLLIGISYTISPEWAVRFGAGALSHILLDLLNKRQVQLLYPVRKGICLRLCSADGYMNRFVTAMACLGIAAETVLFFAGRMPLLH